MIQTLPPMPSPSTLTSLIRQQSQELGFFACGIARADFLEEEAPHLSDWLMKERHAGMEYMARNIDKRLDPRLLVDNARSVVVFLYNYFPGPCDGQDEGYKISNYAYGKDYHEVIREKLNKIIGMIRERKPDVAIRGFVDSAPVLERAWARRAGLGWIGKNSLLITRKHGSFFFLAELITDLELDYDTPFGGDYCGDCSRCMDACPTGAITDPRIVDAGRCISYLTIENKGEMPAEAEGTYKQWIFGCDICQQVCPWNRYSLIHSEPAFLPVPELKEMKPEDWDSLDKEQFDRMFRESPLKRAKFEGLKRNIAFLKRNSDTGSKTEP